MKYVKDWENVGDRLFGFGMVATTTQVCSPRDRREPGKRCPIGMHSKGSQAGSPGCLLHIITTPWEDHTAMGSELFLESFFSDVYRLTVLQDEQHPRPFCFTRIRPSMCSCSLHGDITGLHEGLMSIVQLHYDLPFQYDTIVQTLGTVHYGGVSWADIDNATDGAVGFQDSQVA